MKARRASWWLGALLLIGAHSAPEAAALTQVGSWLSLGSPANDLVIHGDRAYVVTDVGLTIVNLSNPAAPDIEGSVRLGSRGYGVAVQGNYAYAVNVSTDLKVIDISDPRTPTVVGGLVLPGAAWDVAVKDDVAFVAGMSGELYLVDIEDPRDPQRFKVIGLIAWNRTGSDAKVLEKLNAYVTSGNAKMTGVSVTRIPGDPERAILVAFDWGYGRGYFYDVTDPRTPIFAGTHHAHYTFRGEVDPTGTTAYMLSAYGYHSGIYSVPLDLLGPSKSTYHATCGDRCGFFAAPPTDYGGMSVSANGRYVMYIAGKRGEVRVIDVSDPANMVDAGSVAIARHGARTAASMGVAEYRNHVIAAGAALGLGIFHLPGLSD
jgi:hypothetical protein